MKQVRLALYGGGKMGFAMLQGWLEAGVERNNVAVYDPIPSDAVKASRVQVNPKNFEADIEILAVKPQIMDELFATTQFSEGALVISVAAGISIATIEKRFGQEARIVRAMPNTPAAVGSGITAIVGNEASSARDLDIAEVLLGAVGAVVRLEGEADMDAVTGLSGSGPAYVFYMIEAMRAAGEAQGLSAELSHQLALATVVGAGKLAESSDEDPGQLRKNVTSPGGTTQAGLAILMDDSNGLVSLMKDTIGAAADRSRELGKK